MNQSFGAVEGSVASQSAGSIPQSQSKPSPVPGHWAYLLDGLSLGTRKTRGGQSRRQDITGQQAGKMKARRPCLAVGHSILLMGV